VGEPVSGELRELAVAARRSKMIGHFCLLFGRRAGRFPGHGAPLQAWPPESSASACGLPMAWAGGGALWVPCEQERHNAHTGSTQHKSDSSQHIAHNPQSTAHSAEQLAKG
jgi:hypothetical protein